MGKLCAIGDGAPQPWLRAEIDLMKSAPNVYGDDRGRLVTSAEIAGQCAANDAIAKLAGLPAFTGAEILATRQKCGRASLRCRRPNATSW